MSHKSKRLRVQEKKLTNHGKSNVGVFQEGGTKKDSETSMINSGFQDIDLPTTKLHFPGKQKDTLPHSLPQGIYPIHWK